VDAITEALVDAGWNDGTEQRRLHIWELHTVAGVPLRRIGEELKGTEFEVTQRQVWRDWAEIRTIMRELSAPHVESIRSTAMARYESIYASARKTGDLHAAIRVVDKMCELTGCIDRTNKVVVNNPIDSLANTPAKELEAMIANELKEIAAMRGGAGVSGNGKRNGKKS
jgi:hypothetical protein